MHNSPMGERPARRRRVLIEDARRNGHHLRATWHPERGQFVISTWSGDVCSGSARLAVGDVAALVDGVSDAASASSAASPPPSRPGLPGFVDRLRWLVRGTPPQPPATRAGGSATAPTAAQRGRFTATSRSA